MNYIIRIASILCALLMVSCNSEPSLQKYFVDHQEDKDFISLDISGSILNNNKVNYTAEEKEALESIRKINILALPVKNIDQPRFNKEVATINKIFQSEKYETLMKINDERGSVVFKYLGTEEAIDEVIIFAEGKEKGLAIFRVLGDKMQPTKIAKLGNSLKEGKIDLSGIKKIGGMLEM
ncbi:DUF4252 domain-containing protein [Aquimarina sp. TRL1]|uniref:DUF4252 domain-containing protein n=1 Tax=Aquimarina sp. (strain TRL1) TaxID=2736252 RepID=UPI00158CA86F|nr:DUF4252 domain-containing protein [Aquimarina sp. TRL1]QKX06288.1 DUF4252 domain-containing protein [Aquimarina sp. TRL1]